VLRCRVGSETGAMGMREGYHFGSWCYIVLRLDSRVRRVGFCPFGGPTGSLVAQLQNMSFLSKI